jgi:phosphate transport system substrate-binding protein
MLTAMAHVRALLAGICIACLTSTHTLADETLRLGGTGAATELLQRVGTAFATNSGIAVEVIPSLGSSGGISAAADGVLDVTVSGRPLKADEIARGLSVAFAVRTPFVLATSHPNPNSISAAEISDAFTSDKATWGDGTPIRIILRPRSESDTTLMGELFPGLAAAIDKARKRPDVPVAATDQDNASMAEKTPGSLVGSTFTQLVNERRNLRMVAIDGVEPTLQNFERGLYRYGKTLYFITRTQTSQAAEAFIAYLRSSEGRTLLREAQTL